MSQGTITILRKKLPTDGKATLLVQDQELNHIIGAIKRYHNLHKKEYDDIANEFWTGDAESTAKRLFSFLKKYVTYKVEPESNQTIKRPGRIISDGHGDCKHYGSFIVGVCDALARQGHPIEAYYKFVSDNPSRDVHHVFGVVRGPGKEIWVDPVLQGFDERPNFYNHKDVFFNKGVGELTYLSGTEIGKKHKPKKHHKSFKQAMQDFGKSIKKAGYDVSHVALKVGMAPARNAVLALIDVNAFNLATRFAKALQGPNAGGLKQKWRDVGGDEKKLVNAVNNGLKHKAFYHHKASPAKVHGLCASDCIGMGATFHSRWITTHPHRWVHEYGTKPYMGPRGHDGHPFHENHVKPYMGPQNAQHVGRHHGHHNHKLFDRFADSALNPLHPGIDVHMLRHGHHRRRARIHGAYVGEPISVGALMAMAAALLGALAKFIGKGTPQEEGAMAQAAQDGVADVVTKAAKADAAEGDAKASILNALTTPSGDTAPTMSVNTGTDEQGQPQVTVQDVNHPALNNAGGAQGGAASEVAPDSGDSSTPGTATHTALDSFTDTIKATWANHKKEIVIGTGAVLLLLEGPKIVKSIKKIRK